MQASQLALDSYLTSIQADINQLAGTLPDILQRLEDKLDVCAGREGAGGLRALQQQAHTRFREVSGRLHTLPPRHSNGVDGLESDSDGHTQTCNRQEIEPKSVHLQQASMKSLKSTVSATVLDKMEGTGSERLKKDKLANLSVVKQDMDPHGRDLGNDLGRAESSRGAGISRVPSEAPNDATERDNSDMLMGRLGSELCAKLESLEKMLVQIASSVVVKQDPEGDDDEDRRRLKEKLKLAIEADRRSRIREGRGVDRVHLRDMPAGSANRQAWKQVAHSCNSSIDGVTCCLLAVTCDIC